MLFCSVTINIGQLDVPGIGSETLHLTNCHDKPCIDLWTFLYLFFLSENFPERISGTPNSFFLNLYSYVPIYQIVIFNVFFFSDFPGTLFFIA